MLHWLSLLFTIFAFINGLPIVARTSATVVSLLWLTVTKKIIAFWKANENFFFFFFSWVGGVSFPLHICREGCISRSAERMLARWCWERIYSILVSEAHSIGVFQVFRHASFLAKRNRNMVIFCTETEKEISAFSLCVLQVSPGRQRTNVKIS